MDEPTGGLFFSTLVFYVIARTLHQLNIHDKTVSLALADDLLHIVGQAWPWRCFSCVNVLDPLLVIFVGLTLIWYNQNFLITANGALEELEIQVEGLCSEELINQWLKNLVVKVIIDLSTIDRLSDERS